MVTLKDFYKGRDITFKASLSPEIEKESLVTVERVNLLLSKYRIETRNYDTAYVTSGWRPSAINAATVGAAKGSKHLTGQACDLSDESGKLDEWLMTPIGTKALEDCMLWHEHPRDTPKWVHVQTVPPGSRNRHFYAK